MFQIGICISDSNRMDKMSVELEKWMSKIHIYAKVHRFESMEQLHCHTIQRTVPDLLIFDFTHWKQKDMDYLYDVRKRAPGTMLVSVGQLSGIDIKKHLELQIYCSLSFMLLREEIWTVATNAYRQYLSDEESYVFYARPKFVKIPLKKILYFSSDKRKVRLYCTDGVYEFYKKLDMVQEEIASKTSQFLRLHQSYLINQDYIKAYSKHEIKMKNGEILGVSKQHKKCAKQLLKTLNV